MSSNKITTVNPHNGEVIKEYTKHSQTKSSVLFPPQLSDKLNGRVVHFQLVLKCFSQLRTC
ncbi:MAG TPA: hypothetical protein PK498_04845 [Candidatus Kapabacteria bacterium]|nr:hypothetical protein [Candidatus Kapabacteria bacterium]